MFKKNILFLTMISFNIYTSETNDPSLPLLPKKKIRISSRTTTESPSRKIESQFPSTGEFCDVSMSQETPPIHFPMIQKKSVSSFKQNDSIKYFNILSDFQKSLSLPVNESLFDYQQIQFLRFCSKVKYF